MVYAKREGNPCEVLTFICDSGCRKEENKESSEKHMCWEKNDNFAKRCEDQEAIW